MASSQETEITEIEIKTLQDLQDKVRRMAEADKSYVLADSQNKKTFVEMLLKMESYQQDTVDDVLKAINRKRGESGPGKEEKRNNELFIIEMAKLNATVPFNKTEILTMVESVGNRRYRSDAEIAAYQLWCLGVFDQAFQKRNRSAVLS